MKKILYSVMALAIAAMTFTACEDVPEPYPTPTTGGNGGGSGSLPYVSANLNTGWTLVAVTTGAQPWSKGTSYAQATGYQKWDGASEKSNKAVEGWLVSPAISTVGYENVKLSFNHTIKYTNNVSGWEAYHKVYASDNFDGSNASTATWKELDFTPVASPYSDWTLYSSGEIQLPAELVGKETVFIGFWFKAPENASTTWELQAFTVEEGVAQNSDTPETPTDEGLGTAEAPITVAKALEIINSYEAAGESKTEAYVKGKIVSVDQFNSTYKSITYYISDDGTATSQLQVYSGKGLNGADFNSKGDLKSGAVVVVKGKLKKYVKGDTVTPEINQSSQIVSIEGNEGGGDTPTPSGKGSADDPYTVTDAIAAGSGTGVYVKAFIVGSVTDKSISSAEFSTNNASQTNILIAASADETDIAKCMPVQLPTGDVRTALNLADNKGNYKKEVTLYGNIEKYFGSTGLKTVTYAILDGKEIGKKPEGGSDTPAGSVKKVTIAEFNAAAESTDVWYQITGTVKNLKDGDQYGNFDLEDETGTVYVYGLLSEKGGAKKLFQELVAAKGIKNGSKITIIGNRGSYNDKIEVLNAYFVSIETGGGETTAEAKAVTVADFNAAAESTTVWYQLTGTISNLKEGDQYGNFDLTDATGTVYVYGVLSEKGGEKKKFQDLVAAKGIKNGSTITIIGNRGSYKDKIEVMNAYFVSVSN